MNKYAYRFCLGIMVFSVFLFFVHGLRSGDRPSEGSPLIGGWYDPEMDTTVKGNAAIYYWNGVIDRFHPMGSYSNYDKQGYLEALRILLDQTPRPVIVDLPYHAKGDMTGSYHKDTVTLDWWPSVIAAVDAHPMVLGYYLFDEPEAWGEFEYDPKPRLSHEDALAAYRLVKQHSEKDAYSVFVDVPLFNQKYGGREPFFDVFMFDAYLFKTEERLRHDVGLNPYWDYEPGSRSERKKIYEQMLRWKNEVIEPHAYSRVMYVGQGTGERSIRPCGEVAHDGFGQRSMTEEEFLFIEALLKEHFPAIEGYFLWSWFYSNPIMRERGNRSLLRMGVGASSF